MSKRDVVAGCVGALLIGTSAAGFFGWRAENKHVQELEKQIRVLQQQEKLSAVDRSISKQMEEIAYQQQAISEERRDEAIQQSLLAQEMTRRSEVERQNALKAQKAAEHSEKEARDAYHLAESQRQIADQQRMQAEYSKSVADTLKYISIGRNLGSQAFTLYRAGNTEIGTLLAYASLLFTKEYKGDLYTTSVYQALTQSSKGKRSWSIHQGGIICVDYFLNQRRMMTVSNYGEIFTHKMVDGQLVTNRLFQNKDYDFRDAFALTQINAEGQIPAVFPDNYTNGKCYAVSRTGHLVVVGSNKTVIVPLEHILHPARIVNISDDASRLLIVGENSLALLNTNTDRILKERQLDFKVTYTGRFHHKPLLFDDQGKMHVVNSIDDITTSKVPVPGKITSFASSENENLSAYGTSDGTIWLVDAKGQTRQLVGHLSQVTKMKFNGKRLYSSSYDGKLLFWFTGTELQIRPITLFQGDDWLLDFTNDSNKENIWIGDADGKLTEYLISLDLIQERLKNNVVRDLTQEEWNYYIGKSIPFRSFLNNGQQ